MNLWLLLAWVVAFIGAIAFGTYIGRTWSSLPTLHPGSIVKFRGSEVGVERHMMIESINYETDHTTATLIARKGVPR